MNKVTEEWRSNTWENEATDNAHEEVQTNNDVCLFRRQAKDITLKLARGYMERKK